MAKLLWLFVLSVFVTATVGCPLTEVDPETVTGWAEVNMTKFVARDHLDLIYASEDEAECQLHGYFNYNVLYGDNELEACMVNITKVIESFALKEEIYYGASKYPECAVICKTITSSNSAGTQNKLVCKTITSSNSAGTQSNLSLYFILSLRFLLSVLM